MPATNPGGYQKVDYVDYDDDVKMMDANTVETETPGGGHIPSTNSSQELIRSSAASSSASDSEEGRKDVVFVPETSPVLSKKELFTVLVLCFVNLINYMDRFTIAGECSAVITGAREFATCQLKKSSDLYSSLSNDSWAGVSERERVADNILILRPTAQESRRVSTLGLLCPLWMGGKSLASQLEIKDTEYPRFRGNSAAHRKRELYGVRERERKRVNNLNRN